jgi:HKD family nuclease
MPLPMQGKEEKKQIQGIVQTMVEKNHVAHLLVLKSLMEGEKSSYEIGKLLEPYGFTSLASTAPLINLCRLGLITERTDYYTYYKLTEQFKDEVTKSLQAIKPEVIVAKKEAEPANIKATVESERIVEKPINWLGLAKEFCEVIIKEYGWEICGSEEGKETYEFSCVIGKELHSIRVDLSLSPSLYARGDKYAVFSTAVSDFELTSLAESKPSDLNKRALYDTARRIKVDLTESPFFAAFENFIKGKTGLAFTDFPALSKLQEKFTQLKAEVDRSKKAYELLFPLPGERKILDKLQNMMEKARSELLFVPGFLDKGGLLLIRVALEKALEKGVKIKMIVRPEYLKMKPGDKEIIEYFRKRYPEFLELRVYEAEKEYLHAKFLVKDSDELLVTSSNILEYSLVANPEIAMWTNEFAKISESRKFFDFLWKKASSLK